MSIAKGKTLHSNHGRKFLNSRNQFSRFFRRFVAKQTLNNQLSQTQTFFIAIEPNLKTV